MNLSSWLYNSSVADSKLAANDYYNSAGQSNYEPYERQRPHPQLPSDSFSSYEPHNAAQHSAPLSPISTIHSPFQDSSPYRPYAHSQDSGQSPYYATGGGGRDTETNPFADQIPLRESPTKGSADAAPFQDHLPEDPAVTDAPPRSQSRRKRKKGLLYKFPWAVYTLTFVQIIVFIAELAKNGVLTGSPIEIHPTVNPMIGPSPYVLINMGARYVPCMRLNQTLMDTPINWPCPNTTSTSLDDPSNQCAMNNLCGFGDQAYTTQHPPNQWFRFIIPMFLHAGIIHIAFNMLLQILLGRDMERAIGSIRFLIVYLSSGIFGFVLGGNFAPPGIASTGASGSLFGIIAISLLDLLYHWGERRSPWIDLIWIIVDVAISFVLGLLPGLDNFSHIGGFLCGLTLGVCLLHSPDVLRRRADADLPPYASVRQSRKAMDRGGVKGFIKEPAGFFKARKPLWWVWWLVRAAALLGVLISFIVLVKNFYKDPPSTCSWCYRLSCLVSLSYVPCLHYCHSNGLSSLSRSVVKIGVTLGIFRQPRRQHPVHLLILRLGETFSWMEQQFLLGDMGNH